MKPVSYDRRDIFSKDGSPEATDVQIKLVTQIELSCNRFYENVHLEIKIFKL